MAEKLDMQTKDLTQVHIAQIGALFPNAVKEVKGEDGIVKLEIDFDVLRQELSDSLIDEKQERYQMTWPDKKKSILLANQSIRATLRPVPERSVNFETTKNIYIEGDNLDVLKALRETYLGKVKVIYIDPPYNTGSDFIYEDDFSESAEDYASRSGQYDEQGNRLVENSESNGRFHTDWLNMIYPRLRLAKDFLSNDGVIFVSIDENEVHNLRKIMDEIFSEGNFVSMLGWQKVYAPKNQARYFSNDYEFVLCYAKNIDAFAINLLPRTEEMNARYKNPDNDPRGDWKPGDCVGSGLRTNGSYEVVSPITGKVFTVPQGKHWVYAQANMQKMIQEGRIWFGKDGNAFPAVKQYLSEVSGRRPSSWLSFAEYGHTDMAKKDIIKLFPDFEEAPFDTPKPVKLIKMLSLIGSGKNDIIMDFFAGSGTTAQSIFELNHEDGSQRQFILVQLPEILEGRKFGSMTTISDVAQERIRRAGQKILDEAGILGDGLDVGFRVLRLDSTNMKDVYYNPLKAQQSLLLEDIDNIKSDRTHLDLLFQVMLDLGVELNAKIEETEVDGKKVFKVGDNFLVACFASEVTDDVVREIAKLKPVYVVFRDASFKDDASNINCEQIIKAISPTTELKVL